ncbi:MAG TPA: glucose 1-dehydrogenase, partial [Pyrinomonadaceae bacterium]|nr:glucose 1-dehydrogenase [Pyrinomonadaceae bacterium]
RHLRLARPAGRDLRDRALIRGRPVSHVQGKVAVVTGATSGIGRATALRFAEAGARVAIIGRNAQTLKEVASEIQINNGEALTIRADVTVQPIARRIVEQTVEKFGGIDVLVNSAGHLVSGTIEDTTLATWDSMLNVNLRAVFNLMQQAMPHLIKSRGNVVNVSSVTGLRAFPGVLAYCVSKAGLDQLTRCAALELAPKGVRVNAVNPGVVVTDIHRRGGMSQKDYKAFLERSKETHPIGRVGQPYEIAELILYLASERAAWITGATYSIDGGRAQTCAR